MDGGFAATPNLFTGGVINDSDDLCTLCGDGGLILLCDGPCHRSFHLECIGMDTEPEDEHWLCPDCAAGRHMCLICKQVGEMGVEFGVIQCSVAKCGRFYHKGCLAKHPRVEWVGKKRFRCPSHFCHGCSQEEQLAQQAKKRNAKKEPVVSCIHCAQSFHPKCIPSTEQYVRLSTNLMICANHLRPTKPVRNTVAKTAVKKEDAHEPTEVAEDAPASPTEPALSVKIEEDLSEKRKNGLPAEKLCGLCGRGDEMEASDVDAAPVEGPFIEQPVRLQFADKSSKLVYIHLNCALHSPEVFVKPDGTFCNLTRAIKRGKQLKCTACKQTGATVGCVVEKCRCNYHLRCAVESGGEFLGSPYTLYCKSHAAEKKNEPTTFCTCGTQNAEDRGLSLLCGSCGSKFHPKCVNMSERQAGRKTKDKSWICARCTGETLKDVSMSRQKSVKREGAATKRTAEEESEASAEEANSKKASSKRRRVAFASVDKAAEATEEVSPSKAPAKNGRARTPAAARARPKPKRSTASRSRKASSKPSRRTTKKSKPVVLSSISPHEGVSDSTISDDDDE